jgi:long-chain acyl-CoA synthetase
MRRNPRPLDPRGKTLPQLLVERAGLDGDTLALRQKALGIWQTFSWREVRDKVAGLSEGLLELGLSRGETVAIIGENEPEHFFAEYAAQACGAVSVSMYPDLTAEEMQYILAHCTAVVLFAQDQEQVDKALEIADRLPALRHIVYWDDRGMWSYSHPLLRNYTALVETVGQPGRFASSVAMGRSDDAAVLLYTSGTTGRPKGVVCSHASLLDNAMRLDRALQFRPGGEHLSYISPAWAIEQQIGLALSLVAPLVVNFPERPETMLADFREIGVDSCVFTPRQWESIASDIRARMLDAGPLRRWFFDTALRIADRGVRNTRRSIGQSALHAVAERLVLRPLRDQFGFVHTHVAICGGAAMAPDVFQLFHAIGVKLRNGYGSTEFGIVAMHQGDSFDLEALGDFMPIERDFGLPIEWRLSDDGELLLKGGTGFGGYLGQPDKTAEKLDGAWFRTGDHFSVRDDGRLVFLERMDDLRVLASGHRYPPQFIETRLRFSPFIKDAMVVGDEKRDFVVALVNIDGEVVTRWAEDRGIAFSTFADLSQLAEVRTLIKAEVERVNKVLPDASKVCRFANLPKELDPDEGELTRTRKLRRDFLAQRYGPLIDGLYAGDAEARFDIPIRYQDGRRGEMKAVVQTSLVQSPPVQSPPGQSPPGQPLPASSPGQSDRPRVVAAGGGRHG